MGIISNLIKSLHSVNYVCDTIRKRYLQTNSYQDLIVNYKIDYQIEKETNRRGRSSRAQVGLNVLKVLPIVDRQSPMFYFPSEPENLTVLACLDLFVFGGDFDLSISQQGSAEVYEKYSSEVRSRLLELGLSRNLVVFPPYRQFGSNPISPIADGSWLEMYRKGDWLDVSEKRSIALQSCYLSEHGASYVISREILENETNQSRPILRYSYCMFNKPDQPGSHIRIIERLESTDGQVIQPDDRRGVHGIKVDVPEHISFGIAAVQYAQRNNFSSPPYALVKALEARF